MVERGDPAVGVWSVAHYWVLRQQAPCFPLRGGRGVVFLGSRHPAGGRGPVRDAPPVCGVCGLLFENCIVDASILRTPVRGPVLSGAGCVRESS